MILSKDFPIRISYKTSQLKYVQESAVFDLIWNLFIQIFILSYPFSLKLYVFNFVDWSNKDKFRIIVKTYQCFYDVYINFSIYEVKYAIGLLRSFICKKWTYSWEPWDLPMQAIISFSLFAGQLKMLLTFQ